MVIPSALIPCREGQVFVYQGDNRFSPAIILYTGAWLSLLADSPSGLKPRKTIRRFVADIQKDFVGVAISYHRFALRLLKAIRNQLSSSDPSITLDIDISSMKKSPIFFELVNFKKTLAPNLLRYILSFLSFGKRVQDKELDSELQTRALRSWLDLECHLGERRLDKLITDGVSFIIRELLLPYFNMTWLPKHGPRRVAERKVESLTEKHVTMRYYPHVDAAMRSIGGPTPGVYLPEAAVDKWLSKENEDSRGRVARLTFVPKDVSSLRSICMEPVVLQWAQQGVRYDLERAISRSPLNRFIRIDDQPYNADAAKAASYHGLLDTLDLSSASDSVGLDLVREVFPAKILRPLLGSRSTHTELPTGEVVQLRKFAPMGSAVCFPVQSILYCAVILFCYHAYIHRRSGVDVQSLSETLGLITDDPWDPPVAGLGAVRVYGDDLIMDSRVSGLVIKVLSSLGFTVNQSKSFRDSDSFRESCGGYYLNGSDVTPFSLKLGTIGSRITPSVFAGLAEASNRLHLLGYEHARDFCLKLLHTWRSKDRSELLPRCLPYGDRWIKGTAHKYQRIRWFTWNKEFQRREWSVVWIDTESDDELRDERYSYLLWQRSPGVGMGPDRYKRVIDTDQVKFLVASELKLARRNFAGY